MTVTIWHNPRCSTSRNALALLKASGYEPEIVEYLKNPPTAETLSSLLETMQLSARDIMRSKEAVYSELQLDNAELTEAQLIEAMVANPILINRPIVITDKGAVLCRPLEQIYSVLDDNAVAEFEKENGDILRRPN
ncbi:arsenate reductase (glutaredoxin) [Psychrobacter sp. FDAARGOS_221]|uniref:arsenate reductase (glutaredoxin) n=1 Tax=Psychrobacter sp. FDAARGOS_221 TaxID=1975705 RepID=UPI000BB58C20|nr:arsenate reductase (glutaredoxin) [Psychrobacter sp. FDAARGOS_221]PNK60093.1 arsenate reductase (glutaredoxin) [Psychrobacter sp. FDAARGOS_221]